PGSQSPSVALADSGNVSFGYEDDELAAVFSGAVSAIRRSIAGPLRVIAVNGSSRLAAIRVNQSYERQKAGDIVRDLASTASVDTGNIEDGPEFPFYVVDDGRSALDHIGALARKSGFLSWFTPEGDLEFKSVTGGSPVQTFQYGE